jgi:hypothetical protein
MDGSEPNPLDRVAATGLNRRVVIAVASVVAAAVGAVALFSALRPAPSPSLMSDPPGRPSRAPGPVAALALWRDFPVAATPRPLVVFNPTQFGGGMDDSPATNGFWQGRWQLPTKLPEPPARMSGFAVVPPQPAVESLRRAVMANPVTFYTPATSAVVNSISLERRPFDTDRGEVRLPAWVVRFADIDEGDDEAVVLAVDASAQFPLPTRGDALGSLTVASDQRTLTYHFIGAAPGHGDCEAEYTPVLQESATAVAVGVAVHPGRSGFHFLGSTAMCEAIGFSREVSVVLAAPLGNRVAVTYTYGAPIAVG